MIDQPLLYILHFVSVFDLDLNLNLNLNLNNEQNFRITKKPLCSMLYDYDPYVPRIISIRYIYMYSSHAKYRSANLKCAFEAFSTREDAFYRFCLYIYN